MHNNIEESTDQNQIQLDYQPYQYCRRSIDKHQPFRHFKQLAGGRSLPRNTSHQIECSILILPLIGIPWSVCVCTI